MQLKDRCLGNGPPFKIVVSFSFMGKIRIEGQQYDTVILNCKDTCKNTLKTGEINKKTNLCNWTFLL